MRTSPPLPLPPGQRTRRRISKTSTTWSIFLRVFIENDRFPYWLPCETKGQALNLAINLNCANLQYADEQAMPDEAILHSAKAKQNEHGAWGVEISTNYTRRGLCKPSKVHRTTGFLAGVLAQVQAEIPLPGDKLQITPPPSRHHSPGTGDKLVAGQPEAEQPDAQEALLADLYGEPRP